jgi:hypothetical protein
MARRGSTSKDSTESTDDAAAAPKGRLAQIRATYTMARKADPMIGLITAASGVLAFLVVLAIGFLVSLPIYFGILGVLGGVLAATIVFGKRAEKAAFSQIEGQPGAAAAAMNMLRKGWSVTPAVAATRNQDIVHRAIGRPGVVLVGEGSSPQRVAALLATEKKKVARFVPDVPVYELQAGSYEGQVPLRRLNRRMMKLPRNLSTAQAGEVTRRLRALGSMNLPIPKGPMPKNVRMPKGPR